MARSPAQEMLTTEQDGRCAGNQANGAVRDEGGDMAVTPLRERKAWQALQRHYDEIAGRHLREIFAEDPGRGERLTAEGAGLYPDHSKNRITDEGLRALIERAEGAWAAKRRDAMFRGEHINVSEDRAVLHVALRMPAGTKLIVDGQNVVADVHEVLGR